MLCPLAGDLCGDGPQLGARGRAGGPTQPPIGRSAATDLGPGVKAFRGGCPSSSSSGVMEALGRRWFVLFLAATAWAQDALGEGLVGGGPAGFGRPLWGGGSGQCPPGWAAGCFCPRHGSLRGGGHGWVEEDHGPPPSSKLGAGRLDPERGEALGWVLHPLPPMSPWGSFQSITATPG